MTPEKVIELFCEVLSLSGMFRNEALNRSCVVTDYVPETCGPTVILKCMISELMRSRNYFGFPLHPPADHSNVMFHKGSLFAMRFEREKGGDKQVEQVYQELWRRIWSEDKDITQPASLSEVSTYLACCRQTPPGYVLSFIFLHSSSTVQQVQHPVTRVYKRCMDVSFSFTCEITLYHLPLHHKCNNPCYISTRSQEGAQTQTF
uniref:DSBA-like thioredoxin domain-containing protein n=1 Tax=Anabas testudineus TaxID=64144 RepID=A0A7N6F7J2_ANATE